MNKRIVYSLARRIVQAKNDVDGLPESIMLPPDIAARVSKLKLIGGPDLPLDPNGVIHFPMTVRENSQAGIAWVVKMTPKR